MPEHSRYFEEIKEYYDFGLYRKYHVRKFVEKGHLRRDEYKEITGEDYPEPNMKT